MNTSASLNQFKQRTIRKKLVVNYNPSERTRASVSLIHVSLSLVKELFPWGDWHYDMTYS